MVIRSLIRTFAGMNQFKENVILVDADHIDRVAFDLTVNFERMIGRRIPKADLAKWIDCVALDGGLRPKDGQQAQVVIIHSAQKKALDNFAPSSLADEINGQAFSDNLGEFVFETHVVEDIADADSLFTEALQVVCSQPEVKRLIVVPGDAIYNNVREVLRKADDPDKHITVLTMQPEPGGQFRQELLGYSLMAALGIKADEIR